jgi:hypothetical protein
LAAFFGSVCADRANDALACQGEEARREAQAHRQRTRQRLAAKALLDIS